MRFVDRFWGKKDKNDTFTFPDIDFDEALFVVDMQEEFINFFLSSRILSPEVRSYYDALRKNIITQIELTLTQNNLVVIVETKGEGKTIPGIKKLVKENTDRTITLEKTAEGITTTSNGEKRISKTNIILDGIKERNALTTVRGINTGYCILESARGIRDKGIKTKVPLGTTLNLHSSTFKERNNIDWNLQKYGDDSDLLDFGGNPQKDLELLSDYL